jgi:hypothetical protein
LQMKAKDSWKDADLKDVFQFLSLGTFKSWGFKNITCVSCTCNFAN